MLDFHLKPSNSDLMLTHNSWSQHPLEGDAPSHTHSAQAPSVCFGAPAPEGSSVRTAGSSSSGALNRGPPGIHKGGLLSGRLFSYYVLNNVMQTETNLRVVGWTAGSVKSFMSMFFKALFLTFPQNWVQFKERNDSAVSTDLFFLISACSGGHGPQRKPIKNIFIIKITCLTRTMCVVFQL